MHKKCGLGFALKLIVKAACQKFKKTLISRSIDRSLSQVLLELLIVAKNLHHCGFGINEVLVTKKCNSCLLNR